MTTRKKLFAYHLIGAVSMSGTLFAVAPALAPQVIGFFVVYVAMVGVMYLAGWLVKMPSRPRGIRWGAALSGVFTLQLAMTAIGGPGPGVFALLLGVVSLWPRAIPVKRKPSAEVISPLTVAADRG